MNDLTVALLDYVKKEGAVHAGVTTVDTLAGGPPSTDLGYVLEGARSAITFALPLNQELFEPFLSKKDRLSHERDNMAVNARASGIALQLSMWLRQKGRAAAPVAANEVYRSEVKGGLLAMAPDVSHRYLAVRGGVGWFGYSGNVITPDYGAAVILGTVVTDAEMAPTPPLPPEDNYCDECRLCLAGCASGMMDAEEKTTVTMGGLEFSYSRRRSYLRCEFVCGGFTGLAPNGRWSTWSPGRFAIPESDAEFRDALINGLKAYGRRPPLEGGHVQVLMDAPLWLTCANCQLICSPDREVRKQRYKLLTKSGVVVQDPDGSLHQVSPEAAEARMEGLDRETRSLYENV